MVFWEVSDIRGNGLLYFFSGRYSGTVPLKILSFYWRWLIPSMRRTALTATHMTCNSLLLGFLGPRRLSQVRSYFRRLFQHQNRESTFGWWFQAPFVFSQMMIVSYSSGWLNHHPNIHISYSVVSPTTKFLWRMVSNIPSAKFCQIVRYCF